MKDERAGPATLALQTMALAYVVVGSGLLLVAARVVLANAGATFKQEPVRAILIVPATLAAVGVSAWAWRSRARRRALLLIASGLPALAILALYGSPLSHDLVRPAGLFNFATGFMVIVGAVIAIGAAAVATLESKRGQTYGRRAGRTALLSGLAAAVLVTLAAFAIGSGIGRSPATQARVNRADGTGLQKGPASGVPPELATGYAVAATINGTIDALPEGPLAIGVVRYTEAAGTFSEASVPGIEYVISGGDRAAGRELGPGGLAFLPGGDREHVVSTASQWYFLLVRSASRHGGLTGPGSQEVFGTDPLPPLPRLNQAETAIVGVLQPHGRTALARSGGVELVLCLDGRVEVNAHQPSGPRSLGPGEADLVLEGSLVQISSPGDKGGRFLAFYLAPSGAPVEKPAGP